MKRFIAGATCPKCGALDTIRAEVDSETGAMLRECVQCDFTDQVQNHQESDSPDELTTRVTPKPEKTVVTPQVIRILPDGNDDSRS